MNQNTTLKYFLNSRWYPVTIYLGKTFNNILLSSISKFIHIITKYISLIVILFGGQQYGNMLIINLPLSLTVMIVLYTSITCSCDSEMLTFTFTNFSETFSIYISISITFIMELNLP